ncbi:MAG: NUDIX domain-containing protein, partial [Parachlamydiaceae bacterium]
RYPDLKTLAKSSLDEVIKMWEGLGYYSRARYIHESAVKLVNSGFHSITEEALPLMKGLGPYTKGALLSFAFKKKVAAVDGNVLRVMSRLTLFEDDISLMRSRKEIERRTLAFLPEDRPWEAMEALIELGALVCKKNPECKKCPLITECEAFKRGKTLLLPMKKQGQKTIKLERTVLIIKSKEGFLVKRGEKGKIMADLYEFPWFEGHMEIENRILEQFGPFEILKRLESVSHGFTRYQAKLHPYVIRLKNTYEGEYLWQNNLDEIPLSSGHRKIVSQLEKGL